MPRADQGIAPRSIILVYFADGFLGTCSPGDENKYVARCGRGRVDRMVYKIPSSSETGFAQGFTG